MEAIKFTCTSAEAITDYSKMSRKSAAATNSFLVLNAPTKKVQDYKQMKPTGAVSWVWDHFSVYDPKG